MNPTKIEYPTLEATRDAAATVTCGKVIEKITSKNDHVFFKIVKEDSCNQSLDVVGIWFGDKNIGIVYNTDLKFTSTREIK